MQTRTLLIFGMVVMAAMTRILPHPPNCTAITAMALFGAATLKPKWLAFLCPIFAMFLGDMAIQVMCWADAFPSWIAARAGFYDGMWLIYVTVALITCLGFWLRDNIGPLRVVAAAVWASAIFFLLTNFGVWMSGPEHGYETNLSGLLECYAMAIPFYQWTLLGDLGFSILLFASLGWAERKFPVIASPIPAT